MKKFLFRTLGNLLAVLFLILMLIPALSLSLFVFVFFYSAALFLAAESKLSMFKRNLYKWTMKVFKRIEKLCE